MVDQASQKKKRVLTAGVQQTGPFRQRSKASLVKESCIAPIIAIIRKLESCILRAVFGLGADMCMTAHGSVGNQ